MEKHERCFSKLQESIHLGLLILVLTLSLAFLTYRFSREPHQNTTAATLAFWEALKGPKLHKESVTELKTAILDFVGSQPNLPYKIFLHLSRASFL